MNMVGIRFLRLFVGAKLHVFSTISDMDIGISAFRGRDAERGWGVDNFCGKKISGGNGLSLT